MTTQAKHTPGPWEVYDNRHLDNQLWIGVTHKEYGEVSHAYVGYGCDEAKELGDMEANAHLIAAAPEMLEALKLAKNIMRPDGEGYKAVCEAIAKAEGRTHDQS